MMYRYHERGGEIFRVRMAHLFAGVVVEHCASGDNRQLRADRRNDGVYWKSESGTSYAGLWNGIRDQEDVMIDKHCSRNTLHEATYEQLWYQPDGFWSQLKLRWRARWL